MRYVASQPWPFPASLMFACHAIAVQRDVVIDGAELDDARWFTRAEVKAAMTAAPTPFDAPPNESIAFIAPPRHAVAWHLIDRWLRG